MRRAIVATVGTAAGLAALLTYKSSGAVKLQKVSVAPAGTTAPTSSSSSGTSTTTTTTSGTQDRATAPTTAAPSTALTRRTYVGGLVQYFYGDIEVEISVEGRRLIDVTVLQNGAADGHSQTINSYAVPILEKEALSAQGLNFNAVSGATFTSNAFAQSLQSALQKARL